MSDSIKRLVAELNRPADNKRVSKSNRTLSLREPQFRVFQAFVKLKGRHANEVVDMLIESMLKEVEHELPPELKAELNPGQKAS